MDIFKLSKSLDELIYDVMMWIIFFPYTLLRVIVRPGDMIDYVAAELRKPEGEELFDRGLSPPLFLFLAIIIGWALAPDITPVLQKQATAPIGEALAASSWNLLLFRLLIYCAFPLAGAAIYEWRTPGGITRGTFRKPFYQQAYLCAPLALVFSLGLVLLGMGESVPAAGLTLLMMLATLCWYIWTQIIFFRRMINASWLQSILWGLCSVVAGLSIFFAATFLIST